MQTDTGICIGKLPLDLDVVLDLLLVVLMARELRVLQDELMDAPFQLLLLLPEDLEVLLHASDQPMKMGHLVLRLPLRLPTSEEEEEISRSIQQSKSRGGKGSIDGGGKKGKGMKGS